MRVLVRVSENETREIGRKSLCDQAQAKIESERAIDRKGRQCERVSVLVPV